MEIILFLFRIQEAVVEHRFTKAGKVLNNKLWQGTGAEHLKSHA